MADQGIEFLREVAACDDKELMQRHIEQFRKAYNAAADKEAADIACGVVGTPRVLALVLDRDEVRSLINDTMLHMEHLMIREGLCVQREFGLREHLLQKLLAFERQLGDSKGG